jgi:hypothetical protein
LGGFSPAGTVIHHGQFFHPVFSLETGCIALAVQSGTAEKI